MCVISPCADPTVSGVYWRENDRWVQYPAALASTILTELLEPRGSIVQLGTLNSAAHPGGDPYYVNVTTMKQHNVRSRYTRDVKVVIDVSTNGASSTVQAVVEEVTSIIDNASTYCKQYPTATLVHNAHAFLPRANSHSMFKRFTDAACSMTSSPQIEVVFHGSPSQNISSICEHGLLPSRRMPTGAHGPADYFGSMDVAINFARSRTVRDFGHVTDKHSMVMFLLITNAPTVFTHPNCFTCTDTTYELPIATVVI